MLPRPTAEPMAAKMKAVRPRNAPRSALWMAAPADGVGALTMSLRVSCAGHGAGERGRRRRRPGEDAPPEGTTARRPRETALDRRDGRSDARRGAGSPRGTVGGSYRPEGWTRAERSRPPGRAPCDESGAVPHRAGPARGATGRRDAEGPGLLRVSR